MTGDGSLQELPDPGLLPHVGSFRLLLDGEKWEWSDTVARMHGYQPGTVTPTTELVLAHKHPEDRASVADTLRRVLQEGVPFSGRHRIVDTADRVHFVVVVGDRMVDAGGAVIGTSGFYIDVTNMRDADIKNSLDRNIPHVVEARIALEQAKGALMLVYGISADHAFEVLTWCSQQSNVKVRRIAEHLAAALPTALELPPQVRDRFDHILLSTLAADRRPQA